MNRVKRAIIMAAGKGERMQPLTNKVPKPLIKVNNIPMIESVIRALHSNGVFEIFVVVGYLKEQFEYLPKKYSGVKLIENPYYQECNNISSLYVVRDHLENAFILDGDQVIFDNNVLNPDFEKSGYNAVLVTHPTAEWLMQTDAKKNIISCSRNGGNSGWQLYSISRWSKRDAKVLKEALEIEFKQKKNTKIYWDDIVMFLYFDRFDLAVYEMQSGEVIEIDSLEELKAIDSYYLNRGY